MIDQFKTLLRVKVLREERLFRELQAKRQQVKEAVQAVQQSQRVVTESESTLPHREDAIYEEVLGKVIDHTQIDAVHENVVDLEKGHQRLKDKMERAIHIRDRLAGELEAMKQSYQRSVRERDKYSTITDGLLHDALVAAEYKEESEIEDLFTKRGVTPE